MADTNKNTVYRLVKGRTPIGKRVVCVDENPHFLSKTPNMTEGDLIEIIQKEVSSRGFNAYVACDLIIPMLDGEEIRPVIYIQLEDVSDYRIAEEPRVEFVQVDPDFSRRLRETYEDLGIRVKEQLELVAEGRNLKFHTGQILGLEYARERLRIDYPEVDFEFKDVISLVRIA